MKQYSTPVKFHWQVLLLPDTFAASKIIGYILVLVFDNISNKKHEKMKKIVLAVMLFSLVLTQNLTAGCTSGTGPKGSAESKESTSEPGIVGKWKAVNTKMDGHDDPEQQKEMAALIAEMNLIYEFTANGQMIVNDNSTGLGTRESKYVLKDKVLESTDPDGKSTTFEIVKITEKELVFRDTKEKMTVYLEKI
jgi:hypothetical protein